MLKANRSGFLVTLLAASLAQAATLSIRNAVDQSGTLTMAAGETGVIEIVLELADGEQFAFAAGVFLDGVLTEGSDQAIQIVSIEQGLTTPPWDYDRTAWPDFPFAIDDYSLVTGDQTDGGLTGPMTIVIDRLTVERFDGAVQEITFEEGARGPGIFDPAFAPYSIAPIGLTPDLPGFVYLGIGDGRLGGAGPFVVNASDEVIVPPPDNDNGNDNSSPVDPGNDNVADDNDNTGDDNDNDNVVIHDNSNDNVAAPPEANDNVPDVPNSENPDVTINQEGGDLLGVIDDGLTEVAVFVDRDDDGNPISLSGLVIESDGDSAKLVIEGGRLTLIEGTDEQVTLTYDEQGSTVTLTTDSSGLTQTVSIDPGVDLSAAGPGQAVAGESESEAMARLLDEVGSFMSPVIQAIDADATARGILDAVGGIELYRYVFLGPAEASVEEAIEEDRVDESGDFGDLADASIGDPLAELSGLTEDDSDDPAPTGGGSSGGRTSFCGLGMLIWSGLTFAGLTLLRPRRRSGG